MSKPSQWWTERQRLLRNLELVAWSKISGVMSFPEKVRAQWKSFVWPRPARRARKINPETENSDILRVDEAPGWSHWD